MQDDASKRQGSIETPSGADRDGYQSEDSKAAPAPLRVKPPGGRAQRTRSRSLPPSSCRPPTSTFSLSAGHGESAKSPLLSPEQRVFIFCWLDGTARPEDCRPANPGKVDERDTWETEDEEPQGPDQPRVREALDRQFLDLHTRDLPTAVPQQSESTKLSSSALGSQSFPSLQQRAPSPIASSDTLGSLRNLVKIVGLPDNTNHPSSCI